MMYRAFRNFAVSCFLIFATFLTVESAVAQTSDARSTGVDSISDYKSWTQAETEELKHQSPTAALFKSMVVPGWGQLGNRKYLKAGIVIALEGTLFLRWRHFRNRTVEARELFEAQPINSLERSLYFQEFEAVRNDRNLFAWLTGTAIFLSMIDAFVDAHLAGFPDRNVHREKAAGASLSLQVAPFEYRTGSIGPSASLSLRF